MCGEEPIHACCQLSWLLVRMIVKKEAHQSSESNRKAQLSLGVRANQYVWLLVFIYFYRQALALDFTLFAYDHKETPDSKVSE